MVKSTSDESPFTQPVAETHRLWGQGLMVVDQQPQAFLGGFADALAAGFQAGEIHLQQPLFVVHLLDD
ncbi:hypothetical protein BV497_02185 [Fulvimonas soli]|nr:hypothetical protein BV497_02185 [Fulvimonas soli]